jgi:hypothetical protein
MFGNEVIRQFGDSSTPEKEYWLHVASQEELPIATFQRGMAKAVEATEAGDPAEQIAQLSALEQLLKDLPGTADEDEITAYLSGWLLRAPELVSDLRQLVGVSDKRLYLDLSYMFSRIALNRTTTLCGCSPHNVVRHATDYFVNILRREKQRPDQAGLAADVIARYLAAKGLADTLITYQRLTPEDRARIVTALILPKEAQQNEAKRRGHGAEVALANLLSRIGCTFRPEEKLANPMAPDPNVDRVSFQFAGRDPETTFSFDIVVVDQNGAPRVGIQGLVQSSDPGQFGVNKSDETGIIRRAMDRYNASPAGGLRPVELWGILDGVGYSENKSGTINKMLGQVHQFVQIKTLYKAALRLHALGLCRLQAIRFDTDFYSAATLQQTRQKYVPNDLLVIQDDQEVDPAWTEIRAGCASVFV